MSVLEDLFALRGRVALVTGGGSGLGYAFASILADAGAHVVVADVDAGRAEKAAGKLSASGSAAPLVLDVADRPAS
jgi:NAD(P)-dependent dehydrogenase (short-subunit alcohol dehydrogenase family)